MHSAERQSQCRAGSGAGCLESFQQPSVAQHSRICPPRPPALWTSLTCWCRSSTSGRTPARHSSTASIRPVGPAPTMITSVSVSILPPVSVGSYPEPAILPHSSELKQAPTCVVRLVGAAARCWAFPVVTSFAALGSRHRRRYRPRAAAAHRRRSAATGPDRHVDVAPTLTGSVHCLLDLRDVTHVTHVASTHRRRLPGCRPPCDPAALYVARSPSRRHTRSPAARRLQLRPHSRRRCQRRSCRKISTPGRTCHDVTGLLAPTTLCPR